MIWTIYLVILIYFFLGFIGFYFINRRKNHSDARNSWIKYVTYFFIIHLLFLVIVFSPLMFRVLAIVIIAASFYELWHVFYRQGHSGYPVFFISAVVLGLFSIGFYLFSGLKSVWVLYSFLIVSIFDSFSQIAGQIWGKRKFLRKISPNKTTEGIIGGIVIALLSAYLLKGLLSITVLRTMLFATGIIAFAFLGDLLASVYKRKFKVKDFSNLIPGHGGFLDRFDSLLAGGTFVALYDLILI